MTTLAEPRSPPARPEAPEYAETRVSYAPLVLTKIRPPQPRARLVERARLRALLDETGTGLVLVSAPAGYGKTTLLATWLQARAATGPALAWYALDASDNGSIPFGSYLVASLAQALGPSDGLAEIEQQLRSSPEVDLQNVMSVVINAVAASERECLLVLDDYHLITAPVIHQAIAFLLERRPENLRIAIGTRSDPPLPIARLRAQGKLAEVRAANLRFTRDETAEFLIDVMQLAIGPDVVEALEARTEGWIVGLQLAALSLAGRTIDTDLIATIRGNSRFLIQYLLEEVVSRQPEEVQDFLLATSILERLSAPSCDAILDHPGTDQILERLERANLFVVALDEPGVWYRYHHLFREFLRSRLERTDPERVVSLHRRASEWHEAHGYLRDAVRHALETRDWTYAADLVERHGMATLMHSEISTVYEWCKVFPEDVLRTHPMLCVLQGWTLVLGYRRDHRDKVEEQLLIAEEAAAALRDKKRGRWLAGQAAVVRTFLGNAPDPLADTRAELALAERALDLLPPDDPLRSTTMLTVGYAHMALQEPGQAHAALEEARTLSLKGRNYYGVAEARFHQARLAHQQGQLRRAVDLCRRGHADIAAVIDRPEQELPAVGSLDIALGCVNLEQNRLAEAEQLLLHGLDVVGLRTGIPYYRLTACLALARLREIQGRDDEANSFLTQLEDLWPDIGFCVMAVRVLQMLRSDLHDDDAMATIVAWSQEFAQSLGDNIPLPGMGPLGAAEPYSIALLAWSRARIAAGAANEALGYLEPQLKLAEARDLRTRIIELSVAESLAFVALGDERRALNAVARALELAQPDGYVRIFDEGPTLARLMVDAQHRGIEREYVDHILEAIGSSGENHRDRVASPGIPNSGLVEPLTAREIEVLQLLESGLLNRQIADQLVISVGTVKRHTANIYGKLGVQTRTQAVVRARGLALP
jgi:LuxR family maltose regulon positive regulatory protein